MVDNYSWWTFLPWMFPRFLSILPRTIASSIPSHGVRRKLSSSTRKKGMDGCEILHQLMEKVPWFVGFQHASTIRLVVQDFAGPSTVFGGMNIDEHPFATDSGVHIVEQSFQLMIRRVFDSFTGNMRLCPLQRKKIGAARFEDYPGGVKTRFKLGRAEVMPYIYVPWPPVAMISGVEAKFVDWKRTPRPGLTIQNGFPL